MSEKLLDELDEDTVLRVNFQGHTNRYVYRFPSGIMVSAWGDRSVSGSIVLLKEDHVRETLSKGGVQEIETVPFERSPFAEGWDRESMELNTSKEK